MATYPGMAPPKRVSGAGYWIGAITITVAIGVGLVLLVSSVTGLIDEVQTASPKVQLDSTGAVNLSHIGCQDLYFFTAAGNAPLSTPEVSVKKPDGADLDVSRVPCAASTSSGNAQLFRIIGSVQVVSSGTHTMKVSKLSGVPSSGSYVAVGRPFEQMATDISLKLLGGLAIGFFGSVVGMIFIIVNAVRRGRAKRTGIGPPAPMPPYAGAPGPWSGPSAPGPPGGYGPPVSPPVDAVPPKQSDWHQPG